MDNENDEIPPVNTKPTVKNKNVVNKTDISEEYCSTNDEEHPGSYCYPRRDVPKVYHIGMTSNQVINN